ncbi:hypothetical protein P3L10_011497 [Capsicum annuum]
MENFGSSFHFSILFIACIFASFTTTQVLSINTLCPKEIATIYCDSNEDLTRCTTKCYSKFGKYLYTAQCVDKGGLQGKICVCLFISYRQCPPQPPLI